MISATIEACFFAPPPGPPNAEALRDYIESLRHWAEITNKSLAEVLVSRATQDVLVTNNCYPIRDWLRKMLVETSVMEYDANTVARLVETLLSRAEVLEERVSITEILVDSLAIDPSITSKARPADMQWETERAAIMLAVIHSFAKSSQARASCLVTESKLDTNVAAVRCQIPLIEHTRADLAGLPVVPDYFSGTVPVGNTLAGCMLGLDEAAILCGARSIDDVLNAFRIALCKYRSSSGQAQSCLIFPTVGFNSHFLPCLQNCGVMQNVALARSALRAMVETVENIQMAKTHPLRTGRGANDPQVSRGGQLAWRRDIDRQYHLHYWHGAQNILELACMVVHEDFHICL
jgi:hypothetical protein